MICYCGKREGLRYCSNNSFSVPINPTAPANKLSEGGVNSPELGGIYQLLLQIAGRAVRVFLERRKFRLPQNDADGSAGRYGLRVVVPSEGYRLDKFVPDWSAPDGRRTAPHLSGGHDTSPLTCLPQRSSACLFSSS